MTPTLKTITLDEVSEKFNKVKEKYKLAKHFKSKDGSLGLMVAKSAAPSGVKIHTDNIKEITLDTYTSYTMYMETPDSLTTNFYNIVLEDNNGISSVFITKYVTTNDWLNHQDQNFEGQITTFRLATDTPNNSGGDIFQHYSEIIDDIDIGGGSGYWNGSTVSSTYPNDCEGMVVTTTILDETNCGSGHTWQQFLNNECTGSVDGPPLYPSMTSSNGYECIPFADGPSNPSNPDDGSNPSAGGANSDPNTVGDSGSYTAIITKDEECLPEEDRPFDTDNSCSLNSAELCVKLGGYSLELLSSENKTKIVNYINSNGCSDATSAFIELAIEALDNNGVDDGEVDFEENIIYDNSLVSFPCHKMVIEQAIGSCSPMTQLILNIFEANDGTNLIFKSSNTLSNVNANTSSTSSYNSTTHTCDITITFRESYLQNASDLAIARTAIHESLHATLVYMFEENYLQSPNGLPLTGFEDFVEAYINHLNGLSINLNEAHHELMTDFIDDIASSLSLYGSSNGHSNSFNFYKKLSWSGDILKTPTYQSLYPEYLNPTDATANPGNVNPAHLDIVNTSAAEENNTTYSYAHPNGTTYTHAPKGNAPNTTEPCN